MSRNKFEELVFVPESEWPFEDMTIQDGIQEANRMVPTDQEYVYTVSAEPGYILIEWVGESDE